MPERNQTVWLYKITPQESHRYPYDANEGEIHSLAMDSSGNIYAGTASGVQVQVPAAPAIQVVAQAGVVTPFLKKKAACDLNLPEELPMAQPATTMQQRPSIERNWGTAETTGIPMSPNYVYKITKEGLHIRYSRSVSPYPRHISGYTG